MKFGERLTWPFRAAVEGHQRPVRRSRLPLRPPVLCWHGFATEPMADPHGVIVQRDALVRQLRLIERRDPRSLDLDGWLERQARGRTTGVLLTVDDALQSAIDIGLPAMLSAGRKPVLFVSPAHLGGTSTWMLEQPDLPVASTAEVAAVARAGVEIGVHGLTHDDLRGLDDAALRRHTVEASDAVADITGVRPRAFAYPFGWWDERARDAVRRAGFRVAFSLYDSGGLLAVSRADVSPPDTLASLRVKMLPGYRAAWRATGRAPLLRRIARRGMSARGTTP